MYKIFLILLLYVSLLFSQTITVLDSLEFDATNCTESAVCKVDDDYLVIVYQGPSEDGYLVTCSIDPATGALGNTVTDSWEHQTSFGGECDICQVGSSNYIAMVYSENYYVWLVTMDCASGNLSEAGVDTVKISYGDLSSFGQIERIGTSNYYLTGYKVNSAAVNGDFRCKVYEIDPTDGSIDSYVDSLDYGGSIGDNCWPALSHVSGDWYALSWNAGSQRIVAFGAYSDGTLDNSMASMASYGSGHSYGGQFKIASDDTLHGQWFYGVASGLTYLLMDFNTSTGAFTNLDAQVVEASSNGMASVINTGEDYFLGFYATSASSNPMFSDLRQIDFATQNIDAAADVSLRTTAGNTVLYPYIYHVADSLYVMTHKGQDGDGYVRTFHSGYPSSGWSGEIWGIPSIEIWGVQIKSLWEVE